MIIFKERTVEFMRKVALIMAFVMVCLVGSSDAAYYIAGEFNGWPSGDAMMTDNGDGTYSYTITGQPAKTRQEFKITQGAWEWNIPSANSWYYTDASGSVTVTYTPGPVDDGWMPSENRLGTSTDPGTWTIAGEFQGWSNDNPNTAMTYLGDGIYKYEVTFATGSYPLKSVVTGSWDSISSDARSINSGNYTYEVTEESEDVEIFVDALKGVIGFNLVVNITSLPHNPSPEVDEEDVLVDGLELSWDVAQIPLESDPNFTEVDPNLMSHNVYIMDVDAAEPNLVYYDTVVGWDAETLRAGYTVSPALEKDSHYKWRVDMVYDTGAVTQGVVWEFYTELTKPIIISQPDHQLVDPSGTALFEVTISSPSTPTYQWYEVDEGALSDGTLASGTIISGSETASLTVSNVQLAEEGKYYCIVNNDSGVPAQSDTVMLGVKRRLAHWSFDTDMQSDVADSPSSLPYNDPALVADSVSGMALECDADPNTPDMLIVDPNNADYFDTCNISMTVAAWIKAPSAYTWGAIVARNGEDGEGWQLRHNGSTLDRISLTTRGVGTEGSGGADEGRASNRTVYDGDWHYAVGTYDGTSKKIYIDGVVSRVYNSEDGSIASDSEPATGVINATDSPVALASRVKGSLATGLNVEAYAVTACILDEVEIYNYALDGDTIAQTYATLSGNSVCPAPHDYDLSGDCIVNLDDLGLMASGWLTDSSVQP